MKYLLFYFITTAALVSVVVPQVSASSGKIYFPDENAENDRPNNDNRWINVGNQYWTTHPGNQGNPNSGGQCVLTSFPPDPQSGCCGRQATADNRITDLDPTGGRDTDVNFANRISGGDETGFTQYPWTVLLEGIYVYQNMPEVSFVCGGALISGKYVLTAAHCISQPGGQLKSFNVNLAEYDRQTFPRDCKTSGSECVENIRMYVEKIIKHPQYDKESKSNDIALLRLNGTVPYTQYIRPICIPTFDVESPDFRRPQFAVAGWGRNGEESSNIKQATVLNLVNREDCKIQYPSLTQAHICAAGSNGRDSCKGDSGGPLMTLYREQYYVSALVSAKRSDFKCGSTNPTLYTNIHNYLGWIRNNIEE